MIDRILLIVISSLAFVVAPLSGQVTRVELRSTVRLAPEASMTLGSIAHVSGPQKNVVSSIGLSSVVGEADGRGWSFIEAEDLRELLEQDARVHAGSVVVSGLGSELRRMDAARPVVDTVVREPEPAVTVRSQIVLWLMDRYEATEETLRYEAAAGDEGFLSTACEGRMLEIRELSKRGRTALRVVVYDGEEVVADQSVLLDVELEREVVVARQRIMRGTRIEAAMVDRETRWVIPGRREATMRGVLGQNAARMINPGQVIAADLVEAPVVIERGDIVTARSVSGGVVVSMRGRASGDAREGEIIEIESLSGSSTFMVRAIAPGRAIVVSNKEGRSS